MAKEPRPDFDNVSWYVGEDEVEWTLAGSFRGGSQGSFSGSPDSWSPPESDEIEVWTVTNQETGETLDYDAFRLRFEIDDKTDEKILERISEEMAERVTFDEEDPDREYDDIDRDR